MELNETAARLASLPAGGLCAGFSPVPPGHPPAPPGSAMLKYRVCLFELFGSLCERTAPEPHLIVLSRMSRCLGLPFAIFRDCWFQAHLKRSVPFTIQEAVEAAVRFSPLKPARDAVEAAARVLSVYARDLYRPRDGAVRTLQRLQDEGCTVAVINRCAPEMPYGWSDSELFTLVDEVSYIGSLRPRRRSARVFRRVLQQLDVEARDCLYVGCEVDDHAEAAIEVGLPTVCVGRTKLDDAIDNAVPAIKRVSQVLEVQNGTFERELYSRQPTPV